MKRLSVNSKNAKYKLGLFLNSSPQYGGTFQYNLSILNAFSALDPEKYQKTVVYGYTDWKDHLERCKLDARFLPQKTVNRCIDYAFRVLGFDVGNSRLLSTIAMPYRKDLVAMDRDLWIFPSQDPHSYECRLKSLVTIFDLMHRYEKEFPELSSWHSYRNRETLYKNICKHSLGVLTSSEVINNQVTECFNVSKDRVFILPLTPPTYIYEKVDKAEIANKYELPDKFIFYPAQFWSHKNHRNLIKGFKLISDELPDLKLVLSGHRNHCYKEIRSLVLRLGLEKKVLFVGYVPNQDIRGFYENAVAMVIPSCCPISIPLLEALVCGCPVAIADISFNKEQLGKAALYFNPESVEEIASTLVALNDESVKKSLIKAGEVLQHKFSQELFNTRFASIVELVLTRKYGQKKLNIKTKEIKLIR